MEERGDKKRREMIKEKSEKRSRLADIVVYIGAILFGVLMWVILSYANLAYFPMIGNPRLNLFISSLITTGIVIYFTANWKYAIVSGIITFILSLLIFIYLVLSGFSMIMR